MIRAQSVRADDIGLRLVSFSFVLVFPCGPVGAGSAFDCPRLAARPQGFANLGNGALLALPYVSHSLSILTSQKVTLFNIIYSQ
jgi:hypothetical protein